MLNIGLFENKLFIISNYLKKRKTSSIQKRPYKSIILRMRQPVAVSG